MLAPRRPNSLGETSCSLNALAFMSRLSALLMEEAFRSRDNAILSLNHSKSF